MVCLVLLSVGIAANFEHLWRPASMQGLLGVGDSHEYFGPRAAFLDWSIARGELPQWSPLTLCGQPFAANPQTGALYPPNLLRSLLTFEPTPLRTHVGIAVLSALHILIAGLGTFALARAHKLSTSASLVSAWAFAFSASFMRRVVCNQFLGVVSWLPLILLALKRSAEVDGLARRQRALITAGLLFGLSLLGGFPQLSIYIGVGLTVYLLGQRLLVARPFVLTRLGQDIALLILIALIGALVAAPMLLPAVEFISASTRADPSLIPAERLTGVTQYAGLGQLLDALVIYPGAPDLALNYRAAGATVFILALVGLVHTRRRAVAVLALLFLAFLDCSLGPPFPLSTLLSVSISAPLIAPSRGFILACLPLALLAGFGVDALRYDGGRRSMRKILPTLAVVGLGAGILAVLGSKMASPIFLSRSYEVVLLPLALCCGLVGKLWWRGPWNLLLLALVVGETVIWNRDFVPHMLEKSQFEGETDGFDEGQSIPLDNRRFSYERSTESLYRMRPTMNGYDPLQLRQPRRVMCAPDMEPIYDRGVEWVEVCAQNQRGNLFLKRPFWLANQFVREVLPGKGELFPVATTVFLQTPSSLQVAQVPRASLPPSSVSSAAVRRRVASADQLRWNRIKREGSWRMDLPEFQIPADHSALILQYQSSESSAVDVMFRGPGRREPGFTVVMEDTGGEQREVEVPLPDLGTVRVRLHSRAEGSPPTVVEASLSSDPADENELLSIRDWGANSVVLDVGPVDGYRLLSFVDAAFPGWTATVDGQEVPILLANDAFKAIEIPPGTHEVRFAYSSSRMWIGLLLCLTTLSICALLMRRTRVS